MLRQKLKRYKVMRKRIWLIWGVSCLCVLLVPIGIGFAIYQRSIKVGMDMAYDANNRTVKMVQDQIDHEIGSIYGNLKRLSINDNLMKIADLDGPLQAEDQYRLYLLSKELTAIVYSEELVDDVFVYFSNQDKVASTNGNVSLEMYYDMYFKHTNVTFDEFKEYILSYPSKKVLTILDASKDDYVLFTTSNLQYVKGHTTATIGIRISREKLKGMLKSISADDGYNFMILDSQNRLFFESNEVGAPMELLSGSIKGEAVLRYEVNDEKYIGAVANSQYCDLIYAISMPVKLIEEKIGVIRSYAVIGLFSCLILGGIIVCLVVKLNYSPLKKLLSLFKDKGNVEYSQNEGEYKWLISQTEGFFHEHSSIRKELNKKQRTLKNYDILQLLEGTYEHGDFARLDDELNLSLRINEIRVILFKMNDKNKGLHRQAAECDDGLDAFIIANISKEIIGEYYRLEVLEMSHYVTAVVDVPQVQEDTQILLKELIEAVEVKCEELIGLSVGAYAGGMHRGEEGIHQSYLEAKQAMFYEDLLDSRTIYYDDIKNENKKYDYSQETETRITNAVRVADEGLACQYVNEIIENNLRDKRISTEMRNCLLADVLGTIIKCTDDLGCRELEGSGQWYHRICEAQSIGEIQSEFRRVIEELCINMHRVDKNEDRELCRKIDEYIANNFTDVELNISRIGLYLNLTPAYVSTIYKRQTGRGLLKYINTLRVDRAKDLLLEGYTVMEVAEKVGFSDRSSFIRVFKQYTGVTPGQIKQSRQIG